MAIDTLNNIGYPDRYDLIKSDEGLLGIMYTGKKEEVILEPKYTACTVFKALGKVWLAYLDDSEDADPFYVIRNKKGDVQTEIPVYDFVANSKALYGQIETDRGIELAQFDKDLSVVRTFGKLKFKDYCTSKGNRILPNTKQSLEVEDSEGRICRINMIDNTLEDVISFGDMYHKRNIAPEKEEDIVEEWVYEVNFTKETIGKHDLSNNHKMVLCNIGEVPDVSKLKATLDNIFKITPTEVVEEVPVKRHYEKHKKLIYSTIENDKAVVIDKILKAITPDKGSFDDVQELIEYLGTLGDYTEALAKLFTEDFQAFFENYGVKIFTSDKYRYILVKNSIGKVTILKTDLADLDDYSSNTKYKIKSFEVKSADTDFESGKSIPKPPYLGKKNNSWYKRVIAVDLVLENDITLNFIMFDRFTYGPLAVDGSTGTRYNYNDKNIVLSTTTSDIFVTL